jgi:hypothetical protein
MSSLDNFTFIKPAGKLDGFSFIPETSPQDVARDTAAAMGDATPGPVNNGPGFLTRAARDVQQTVGNWISGAQAGSAEVDKWNQALNDMIAGTAEDGTVIFKPGFTQKDYDDTLALRNKAQQTFVGETVEPVVTPGVFAGGIPAIVAAPFVAKGAVESFEKGGPLQVARDFTYGGAVDFATQQGLGDKFYNRPISTIAEGALAVAPAALLGRAVYKVAKGGTEALKGKIDDRIAASMDDFSFVEKKAPEPMTPAEQRYVSDVMRADETVAPEKKPYQGPAVVMGNRQQPAEIVLPGGERGGQIVIPGDYNLNPGGLPTVSSIIDARDRAGRTQNVGGEKVITVNPGERVEFPQRQRRVDDFSFTEKAFNIKEGVDFSLEPEVKTSVEALVREYNQLFPDDPLTVTEGRRAADSPTGSETSYHKSGAGVDFASDGLEADPAKRVKLLELAKKHGFIETLDEYASPSENATGGHVHIGGIGDKVAEAVEKTPVRDNAAKLQQANEALAKQDYATAADLFEQVGQAKVAEGVRRMIGKTELRGMAEGEAAEPTELRGMAQPAPQFTGGPAVEPVMRQQIISKIEDLLTKVWTGRVEQKNWLGRFNTRTEGIRLRDYGDLQTVAHEVGHYLDDAVVPLANASFDAELQLLGKKTSGKGYTPDQIRAEGVAEFTRLYMTDKPAATKSAPNFAKHFERELSKHPEVKAAVDEIGDMTHRWFGQSPEARARSGVSFVRDREKPSVLQRAKNTWMEAYEKVVDARVGLDSFMKEYQRKTGEKVAAENDPYKLARAAHTGATARAEMLVGDKNARATRKALNEFYDGKLEHDVTVQTIIDKINKIAPELNKERSEYLKQGLVENWQEAFSKYLVASRQLEIQSVYTEYVGSMTKADAEALVKNAPKQFEPIAQDFYNYNDNLLRIRVATGMISKELYSDLKAKWKNYASMARDIADEAANGGIPGAGKGFANVKKAIQTLGEKGSGKPVIDPLESAIRDTYVVLNLVERNRVGQAFTKLAEKQGAGRFVEAVQGGGDPNKSIFTVWVDGERKAFQTTPDVYRAIMSMNEEGANFITKILSAPAGWLRAGATLSPEFIVKNVSRDALSAAIYSKVGFVPVYDSLRGVAKLIGDEQMFYEYKASGAMMSTLTAMDRPGMAEKINKLVKDQKSINPLDILRAVNDLGESATRIAEYAKVREKGGSTLEATLAAKDVTIDFSRAGTWGRQYNKVTAFFNAGVQGVDRMARAFREDPVQTSRRIAMYITAPSVALWWYAHDDVRYQELPRYQKDLFWVIPTGPKLTREEFNRLLSSGKSKEEILAKAGPVLRIPKPFEVGILFGSGAERMLDWAYMNNKSGIKEWLKSAKEGFTPNLIPTLAVPLIEWATNFSLFTDRPIVPQREQKLPDKLQYGPYTSEVAKKIGEKTDTSPRKIDSAVRSLTGGLGSFALGTVDEVVGNNRPAVKGYERPVVRALLQAPFKNAESERQFREEFRDQEAKLGELKLTGQPPKGFDPAKYGTYREYDKAIDELGKMERAIMADTKMSPAEKRKQLDMINLMQVMYSRQALGK